MIATGKKHQMAAQVQTTLLVETTNSTLSEITD
jgi:hypothetical protein